MATQFETASPHTFLVTDGAWDARGTGWVGDDAREAEITGHTEFRNLGGGLIVVESVMTVHAEPVFEVRQHYDVHRTRIPERYSFVLRTDRVGELKGDLSLLRDYMVLHYASPKGRFRGAEILIRRGPDRYTAVGQFTADARTQIVWEVELTRTAEGAGPAGR
jgi:hypothetical protein